MITVFENQVLKERKGEGNFFKNTDLKTNQFWYNNFEKE